MQKILRLLQHQPWLTTVLLWDPSPAKYRLKKMYEFHNVSGTMVNPFLAKSCWKESVAVCPKSPCPQPQAPSASPGSVWPKLIPGSTNQQHRGCGAGLPHTPGLCWPLHRWQLSSVLAFPQGRSCQLRAGIRERLVSGHYQWRNIPHGSPSLCLRES